VCANGVIFIQNVEQIVKLVQKLNWGGGGRVGGGESHIDKNKTFAFFFIVYEAKQARNCGSTRALAVFFTSWCTLPVAMCKVVRFCARALAVFFTSWCTLPVAMCKVVRFCHNQCCGRE
jgi:hypothetical protein